MSKEVVLENAEVTEEVTEAKEEKRESLIKKQFSTNHCDSSNESNSSFFS